ncbi:MAG TPA: hypothetical protein DIW47_02020 [Bacteroidetes bacterium]|nr:hypothetical protein [Bacteroidota bacterium]
MQIIITNIAISVVKCTARFCKQGLPAFPVNILANTNVQISTVQPIRTVKKDGGACLLLVWRARD